MSDVTTMEAKYLLSGDIEKFLKKKNEFWFFEDKMFGTMRGPFETKEQAFHLFVKSEMRRKEIIRNVWTSYTNAKR